MVIRRLQAFWLDLYLHVLGQHFLLRVLLHVRQHTQPLRRDQAADHLLGHVLGAGAEQLFKLNRAEFLNNRGFLLDALLEPFFKLHNFAFFLVEVLDQSSPSLLHFIEPHLQSDPEGRRLAFALSDLFVLNGVLRMPHVVGNELLN